MSTEHETFEDTDPPPEPQATTDAAGGNDLVTSWLRTTVPAIWGASVTAGLAAVEPHLPAWASTPLGAALADESTTLLVTVAAVAGWHAAWRHLEARVPRWLVRLALGSPRQPSYDDTATSSTRRASRSRTRPDPDASAPRTATIKP
jgi:hypothetical protein